MTLRQSRLFYSVLANTWGLHALRGASGNAACARQGLEHLEEMSWEPGKVLSGWRGQVGHGNQTGHL